MSSFLAMIAFATFLMLFRMPVAFAMGLAGISGLMLQLGIPSALSSLEKTFFRSTSSFILLSIPLFILMAELLTAGNVTRRAIAACQAWFGHIRGGLAVATIGAAVIMAALVGSSTASAAAMASSAFPEMRRCKYDERLAAAVISVGGTLAVMIPPSIVLVVYGILTETSIGQLFIAGILPGLLTAIGLMIAIVFVSRQEGYAPKGMPFDFKHALRESLGVWPASVLILLVIGAIYGGVTSPTEAAALGVLGALVLGMVQRALRPKALGKALDTSIRSTVMIIAIVACSAIFTNYLAFTQITQTIMDAVNHSGLPRYAILLGIITVLLLAGMVMDQLAILSLAMPLAFPAIKALGFDPIWFGIIVTKTVEIGLLTPPFGLNAYVTAGQTGVRLNAVFQGLIPFIVVDLIVLALLVAFPGITLLLPGMMQ